MLFMLLGSTAVWGQCTADSPNVELTFTSIDIDGNCAGEPPATDNSLEPTISINGSILSFTIPGSSDGCVVCGSADDVSGNYPVTDLSLIDGCAPNVTISLGAAGGSTMIPITIDSWEEDAGTCALDVSGINPDDDIVQGANFNVDITQATGSFTMGCITYNYAIECPTPCEATACKEVTIDITGVAMNNISNDDPNDLDPAITIDGVTYLWENNIPADDGNVYPLGFPTGNCGGSTSALPQITFTTVAATPNSTVFTNVSSWEDDGAGGACTPDNGGFGNAFNDDDGQVGPLDITAIGVNEDGTFTIGDFTWAYSVVSCTQLLELSADGLVVSACSDEGSAADADDTYTFDLNPIIVENIAGSLGASYDIAFSTVPTNGYTASTGNAYGAATTFGPLLISDGAQIVTVSDASGCLEFDVLVSPPAPCSAVTCPVITSLTSDAAGNTCATAAITYTVVADFGVNATDYTVSWYENGALVAGETGDTYTWNGTASGCDATIEPTISAELVCIADDSTTPITVNAAAPISVFPTPDATQAVVTRTDDVCNYTITHPCTNFTVTPATTTAAPGDAATTIMVTVESDVTTTCSDMQSIAVEACPAAPCTIPNGTWSK